MINPNSYCYYASQLPIDSLDRKYHDLRYGYPIEDDNELFGRLILEINQAGLSWSIILKKEEHFRRAYDQFHIAKIANYNEADFHRLMNDAGIVRNRLKIEAAIHNANAVLKLSEEFGSFKNWLDHHDGSSKAEWIKLFKKTFRFTGGEIVSEFLTSTAYLEGAHDPLCPVHTALPDRSKNPQKI
jgi:DNA-3-methyladenine glycosylase I